MVTLLAAPQAKTRFFSLLGLVLAFSAILLASALRLPSGLVISLAVIFAAAGFAVWKNVSASYLAFLALFPLIPSHLSQLNLPEYSVAEFLFLSLAFWWAVRKFASGSFTFPGRSLHSLFASQSIYLVLSSALFLFSTNLIFSRIFLFQLREHWNLLQPGILGDPFGSLHALLIQLEGLLFLFISLDVFEQRSTAKKAGEVLFYSAVGVSFLGILQYVFRFRLLDFWIKENPNLIRINATMDDPNALGAYLAVAFCLGLYAVSSGSGIKRAINLTGLVLVFTGLALSASRSALASAFLIAIIVPYFLKYAGILILPQDKILGRLSRKITAAALIGLIALITFAIYKDYSAEKPSTWMEFVLASLNPVRPVDSILKGRTALWTTALRMFRSSPLFGNGLGSFLYKTATRPYDYPELRIAENTHNYFLQALAETGLVGILLLLAVLIRITVPAVRALQRRLPDGDLFRHYGILGGILIILITSVTGHPLLLPKMQFVFWALAGLLLLDTGITQAADHKYGKTLLLAFWVLVAVGLPLRALSAKRSMNLTSYEAGYNNWERDSSGRLFRWTKAQAYSDLMVQGRALSFDVRQISKRLLTKPWPVEIYIDDRLVQRVVLADSAWKTVTLPIAAPSRSWIQVTVKPASTISVGTFRKNDPRQLGVQISPFRWSLFSEGPTVHPFLMGVLRGKDVMFRIDAVPVSTYANPVKLRLESATGVSVPYTPELSEIFREERGPVLYKQRFDNPNFAIDSTNSLIIKQTFPRGNAVVRLTGDASCQTSRLPILFVLQDGKQILKIPFLCSTSTDYYFQIPLTGREEELKFSTWDGLSEVTPRTETHIRVHNVVMWAATAPSTQWLQSGWFESRGRNSEVLFDWKGQIPRALLGQNAFFEAETSSPPGIATLTVSASGQLAGNELPRLAVYYSGRVGSIILNSNEVRDYKLQIPVEGNQQIRLVFENDYYDETTKADRNVFISAVRLDFMPAVLVSQPIVDPLLTMEPEFSLTKLP